MKNSSSSQWNVYAELEEIPSTVAPPQVSHSNLALTLARGWRSLLTLFCQELLYEEQVEYLERCMTLNPAPDAETNPLSKLQKLLLAVMMS